MTMVKVYLMDGSYKAIKTDPTKTSVEELWEIASEKLSLTSESCQMFFIWGVSGNLELLLYTHQTVSQVFRDWSIFEQRYNYKPPQNNISPRGISQTLSRTLTRKNVSALTRSGSVDNLGNPEEIRLVFRLTSIVPLAEEKKYNDSGAIYLFYIQAVHNVIKSNYPCAVDTAIQLAGIQLQLTVGDRNPQVHKSGYLVDSLALASYVPEHLFSRMKPEEWEMSLFSEHDKHQGKDNHALRQLYLTIVRQWAYYGCTFFKARNITKQDQHFFQTDFEGKVTIGVNENGVHIIEPRIMKIVTYPYDKVVDWNSQKQIFFLEVEDEETKSGLLQNLGPLKTLTRTSKKTRTKQFYYKSNQAELINDLICDWLEEYYEQKQQQKQSPDQFRNKSRNSRAINKKKIKVEPVTDDSDLV